MTTSAEREREKSGRDRDIYHVFDIGTGRRRACQRRTDQTNQRPGITDVEASWERQDQRHGTRDECLLRRQW